MSDQTQNVATKNRKELTLVLWGITNVGKSTLFNKITKTRKAIVANKPGVTVDTHALTIERDDLPCAFRVVDSGGVGSGLEGHPLKKEIEFRAKASIDVADIVLFVADGTKYTNEIKDLARYLRKECGQRNVPVWLVLNKCDRKDFDSEQFFELGFDKVFPVSGEHSHGIGDLIEDLGVWAQTKVESHQVQSHEEILQEELANPPVVNPHVEAEPMGFGGKELNSSPRILILGRPNVGKSTLMNYLAGKPISAVSNIPGTTRDFLSQKVSIDGMDFQLIDTAGMRRPGRRDREVEWVATDKIRDLARVSDVAVLLCDSDEGITDQDSAVAGFALDAGLSLIIVLNKWDLVKENADTEYKITQIDRGQDMKMAFLQWCPTVRISAKTGLGVKALKTLIQKVHESRNLRVQTSKLNALFENKILGASGVVASASQAREKLYYMSQVNTNPPEFVVFSNVAAEKIHFSFRRYVGNVIREEFGFQGTPIKLHFKERSERRQT